MKESRNEGKQECGKAGMWERALRKSLICKKSHDICVLAYRKGILLSTENSGKESKTIKKREFNLTVCLNTIDKVKEFVSMISGLDAKIVLSSGGRQVDANSILGIFSLDLQHPIQVTTLQGDSANVREIIGNFSA